MKPENLEKPPLTAMRAVCGDAGFGPEHYTTF